MIPIKRAYSIVTHESAECGDYAEHGFVSGGTDFPIAECEQLTDNDIVELISFRDLIDEMQGAESSCSVFDSSAWFSHYSQDMCSGDDRTDSVHLADDKYARYWVKAWELSR